MRKALLFTAGILGAGLTVLLLSAGGPPLAADDGEPAPMEPTYVLYIPVVMKSPETTRTSPLDWCSCGMYQKVAGIPDGLRCACASARPESLVEMFRAGTGRAPSPLGGYGTYAGRSFLLFPERSGSGTPVLRVERGLVGGINAARCWVDVHVFSLPANSWTIPFTVTDEMWGMVGPRLGSVVVDTPQEDTQEITLTIPLSGFSPALVVLSRCENQHELCAIEPYRYSWSVIGLEAFLEWQEDFWP